MRPGLCGLPRTVVPRCTRAGYPPRAPSLDYCQLDPRILTQYGAESYLHRLGVLGLTYPSCNPQEESGKPIGTAPGLPSQDIPRGLLLLFCGVELRIWLRERCVQPRHGPPPPNVMTVRRPVARREVFERPVHGIERRGAPDEAVEREAARGVEPGELREIHRGYAAAVVAADDALSRIGQVERVERVRSRPRRACPRSRPAPRGRRGKATSRWSPPARWPRRRGPRRRPLWYGCDPRGPGRPPRSACVAPSSRASARRSSERSTAITGSAPTSPRPSRIACPTPPHPSTTADSPGRTRAVFVTAPTPVVTAHPIRAATGNGTSSGIVTAADSGTTVASAKVPRPRKAGTGVPSEAIEGRRYRPAGCYPGPSCSRRARRGPGRSSGTAGKARTRRVRRGRRAGRPSRPAPPPRRSRLPRGRGRAALRASSRRPRRAGPTRTRRWRATAPARGRPVPSRALAPLR